jgi:hypothetical protein
MTIYNSIQIRGMYITFILSENFIFKKFIILLESGLTYVLLVLEYLEVCRKALN